MGNKSANDFQRAFEEIRQFCSPPRDECQEVINIVSFVQILFGVAGEHGEFSGRWGEDNRLHFQIRDETPIMYEFNKGNFRSMLPAIANFARLQCSSLEESEKLNFYGDSQTVRCEMNGSAELFHVETANRLGRTFYFMIRKQP